MTPTARPLPGIPAGQVAIAVATLLADQDPLTEADIDDVRQLLDGEDSALVATALVKMLTDTLDAAFGPDGRRGIFRRMGLGFEGMRASGHGDAPNPECGEGR